MPTITLNPAQLQAILQAFGIPGLGTIDATVTLDTGSSLADLNYAAQLAATTTGFGLNMTNGWASANLGASGYAALTALAMTIQDYQQYQTDKTNGASSLAIEHDVGATLADGTTLAGDALNFVGALVTPDNPELGAFLSGWGSGLTVLGVGLNHLDSISDFSSLAWANIQAGTYENFLSPSQSQALGNASAAVQSAWSSVESELSATFSSLTKLNNDAGTSSAATDESTLNSTFDSLQTSLTALSSATGTTQQPINEAYVNNTASATNGSLTTPTYVPTYIENANNSAVAVQMTASDGSGSVTADGQTFTYTNGVITGVTVGATGDASLTLTLSGKSSAETLDLNNAADSANVDGVGFSDSQADSQFRMDAQGNLTIAAPLAGYGANSLFLGSNGLDSFLIGPDSIGFPTNSLQSFSDNSGSLILATSTGNTQITTNTASNLNFTVNGTGETTTLDGTADSATINGSSDSTNLSGAGENVTAGGKGDSIVENGASDGTTLNGTNESLSLYGSQDSGGVYGSANTVTFYGNSDGEGVNVYGTNNHAILNGAGEWVGLNTSGDSATENGSLGTVIINGTNNTLALYGSQDGSNVYGSGNTVTFYGNSNGEGVNLYGTSNKAVLDGTGGWLGLNTTSDGVTLNGNSNTIDLLGTNDTALINSNFNNVQVTGGSGDVITDNGSSGNITTNTYATTVYLTSTSSNDSVLGSNDHINLATGSVGDNLTGSNDIVNMSGNETFSVESGTNDTFNTNAGDNLAFYGTNENMSIAGNSTLVSLTASNETANLTSGTADTFAVYGSLEAINSGLLASTINFLSTSSNDSVTGSNDFINVATGSVGDSLNGNNDVVSMAGNEAFNLTGGTGDLISATSGDTVNVSSNDPYAMDDVIIESNATINIASNERVNVFGSNDKFVLGTNDYVGSWGSNDTITAGTYDGIWLENSGGDSVTGGMGDAINVSQDEGGSANDTINVTDGVVDVLDNSTAYINGSNDTVDTGNNVGVTYASGDTNNPTYSDPSGTAGFSGDGNDSGGSDGGDPLVLNFTGGKVQTTALANSKVYFDVQNSCQSVQTGWITSGEGFLVYDPYASLRTLTAANFIKSFSDLAAYNTNHDGVISNADFTWTNLYIWTPSNGGTFSSSDLHGLTAEGIKSINLTATPTFQNNNNNVIIQDGSFTTTTGATDDISEVYLQYNSQNVSSTLQWPLGAAETGVVAVTAPNTLLGGYGNNDVADFKGTTANINGTSLYYFNPLEEFDFTDLSFPNATLSFTETTPIGTAPVNAKGVLTVTDGTHTAKITLFGQFMAAGFQTASDNGAGTFVTYVPPVANYSMLAAH